MPHANHMDLKEMHGSGDGDVISSQDDHSEILSIGGMDSDEVEVHSHYVYPTARFSNVLIGFIVLDTLVAVILWLTVAGSDSQYFMDNITHYRMTSSVFDLAVISLLKCTIFLPLILRLDSTVKKSLDISLYNPVLKSRQKWIFGFIVFLSLVIFIFCVAKGGLILNAILNTEDYPGMRGPYYGCVIWCVVTSLCNVILCSLSLKLMGRMRSSRKLKYYDQFNDEVDEDGTPLPPKANLYRLIGLARPDFGLLALACLMLFLSSVSMTLAPLFFGKVVDAAVKSMDELNKTVLSLLGMYMAGAVASLFRTWFVTLAGQRLVARLRSRLFASIIVQDVAFFDTTRTGDLCNRLSSDTQVLQNALTVNVVMLFRDVIKILGSLGLMLYLNASLAGVLFAVVPVVIVATKQYGKYVRTMRKKFQDHLAEAGTKAEEALSSVRTVKSFSGEKKETSEYSDLIHDSYNIGKKLSMSEGIMEGVLNVFAGGAIAAVLWYGGKLVNDNTKDPDTGISTGLLTSFSIYTLQVGFGLSVLANLYGHFMQAVGASVKIFKLFDRKPNMFTIENPTILSTMTGELTFHNVDFTYAARKGNKILWDISFTVKPGEMVALVGPSGGGKSTIVSLIERFYDPDSGMITVDGHDLKMLDPFQYRSKISIVSQEPTLFAYSIKDNIAYGRKASDEEVEEAAKQANAHEFISEFRDGYDTMVGERGVRLSGGQKQRVAIARALVMNPTILLLDEATSALDAESEHLVQEAVDRAMGGRTVLVIAHRLSTVKNANKVIVIDKGRIVEMGTHSELLAINGVYKRLVLRQLMTRNESNKAQRDGDNDSYEEQDGQEMTMEDGAVDGDAKENGS